MNAGFQSTTESVKFTDTEGEELTEYRPVSRWAVLAAVLGVLSPTALLHPSLLLVPIAGIVVTLFAARQLSAPTSMLTGHTAMKWGLFLNVLFGTFAGSWLAYHDYYIDSQARQRAEAWLALVCAGNLRDAHQLTLDDIRRVPIGSTPDQYYADPSIKSDGHSNKKPDLSDKPDPKADSVGGVDTPSRALLAGYDLTDPNLMENAPAIVQLYEFSNRPLIVLLKSIGKSAEFQFLRTVERQQPLNNMLVIDQEYAVLYHENGQPRRKVLKLSMQRALLSRVATWKIVSLEQVEGG